MSKKKPKQSSSTIGRNKKVRHDFQLDDRFEAGIALEGWEVKSLREGRLQLQDSHVIIQNGEAFLLNALITPLPTASTHIHPTPSRARKLLLHRRELDKLIGAVERKGMTIVALAMYWSKGRAKIEIAIAKGKREFDKRADEKDRDWKRQKERLMRH